MKFLALERENPSATAEGFRMHGRAEAARAWELYRGGIVRELYFDARNHCAVLMLECADESAARSALDSLPMVRAGLISFELIPLAPYDGFERLFTVS